MQDLPPWPVYWAMHGPHGGYRLQYRPDFSPPYLASFGCPVSQPLRRCTQERHTSQNETPNQNHPTKRQTLGSAGGRNQSLKIKALPSPLVLRSPANQRDKQALVPDRSRRNLGRLYSCGKLPIMLLYKGRVPAPPTVWSSSGRRA